MVKIPKTQDQANAKLWSEKSVRELNQLMEKTIFGSIRNIKIAKKPLQFFTKY